jgi:hypothetical protein
MVEKLINATTLGIIYHPELRGKLSDGAKKDIHEMIKTLVESVLKQRRTKCENE